MNRYVRRGAKGIALLDESSGFPRLYCIFDVSDTGVVPLAAAMQKGANMNTNSRNVTYSTVGDYQLPNLTLNQPRKPLGKYARLRRTYLMNHRSVLYNTMLLNGSLYPHLMEVKQTAENAAIEAESEKPSAFVILRMKSTGCCGQALILRVEKS